MSSRPLQVSLDTLIAASPMLGHKLEDRSRIRDEQDPALVRGFQSASALPFANEEQSRLFLVAPLDILVEENEGQKRFHIIETNGAGIGGLTNLPIDVIAAVLQGLTEFARNLPARDPVVLVAVSGLESSKHPRHNHLLHEKLLYVDSLQRGLAQRGETARVFTIAGLREEPTAFQVGGPAVVLGYIKEFLNELTCDRGGRLALLGRQVDAAVNDRFCLNVVSRFGHQIDMSRFLTMNRCFAAGADKGVALGVLQEYAKATPRPHLPERIEFGRVEHRAALIAGVVRWLRQGQQLVIKPQGTGLGHGLEFFLDREESLDAIVGKVDHSIRVTEHYYGAVGGAFPYTLCPFVDTCAIADPDHELHGHKYELRVVVYRDGAHLKALPSITKISSQGYDADKATRLSLINNITTSAEAKKRDGTDFMLPLCNSKTLTLLGISRDLLEELCVYCTGYIRFILERVQEQPERFALAPRQ